MRMIEVPSLLKTSQFFLLSHAEWNINNNTKVDTHYQNLSLGRGSILGKILFNGFKSHSTAITKTGRAPTHALNLRLPSPKPKCNGATST